MTSIRIRPILAIGVSLFALAGASLLDVARMQPQDVAAARSDREDIASAAADCVKGSVMAACAHASHASMQPMPPVTTLQVFQENGKSILVKTSDH